MSTESSVNKMTDYGLDDRARTGIFLFNNTSRPPSSLHVQWVGLFSHGLKRPKRETNNLRLRMRGASLASPTPIHLHGVVLKHMENFTSLLCSARTRHSESGIAENYLKCGPDAIWDKWITVFNTKDWFPVLKWIVKPMCNKHETVCFLVQQRFFNYILI
jgi:hypothetical protein